MTKPQTIDDRLERIAVAEERQATALEGILEAVTNFKFEQVGSIAVAGVQTPETDDAEATDETAPEETATAEPEVEETPAEADTAEETAPEDETPAEEPAEDGDPLGDGDAAVDKGDAIEIPEKLNADHVRNLAREVMGKDGKPAVFEVLAEIGAGYKAVGEIAETDLEEAFVKMTQRLRG